MPLLPNTETTHNSYAACGRKDNTRHNDISLLWPEKEIVDFFFRVKWAVPLPSEGGEEAKVLGENP
jgi:hypothetical protein